MWSHGVILHPLQQAAQVSIDSSNVLLTTGVNGRMLAQVFGFVFILRADVLIFTRVGLVTADLRAT